MTAKMKRQAHAAAWERHSPEWPLVPTNREIGVPWDIHWEMGPTTPAGAALDRVGGARYATSAPPIR